MKARDDPHTQAILLLNKQTQDDPALLASIFAIDAVRSGRHNRESIADLFDFAGSHSELYENSVLKSLAETIRGEGFPTNFTVIQGGKLDD